MTTTPAHRDPMRSALRHAGVRCAALCAVSTAATAAALALPAVLGRALDLLLAGAPAAGWVARAAALVLLLAVLDGAASVLAGTVDARATAGLRKLLTGRVLALGPRAVARFGAGDLVARLVGNAAQAGTGPAAVAALLAALAGPLGGVVALALVDPWLAAVFLAGAPVLAVLLRAFTRDTSACVAEYQRVQGRIAAALAEAVDGHRTIAAAGLQDRETARVLRPLPELARAGHRMWRVQGRAAAQAVTVGPLLQLAVVAVAGLLLARHRISVGEVLAASRYAVLATGVGVLVGQLAALTRARASAGRLGEVAACPVPGHGSHPLPPGPGRLEFRGVTARRGGRAVLDGVDLSVPGGTVLAVVGRSGTGKSLLAELAGRLTDPDAGQVLLDGVPLPALPHDDLRRAVTYAFARPALLGTTVEDTIAFGRTAPTPAGIRAAARKAQADAYVRRLPDGYATRLADAPRSGGESQRLGLARAFAHPGRLFVLDDALSSLDTVTEHRVTRALLAPGPTRLIVAHRATTAAHADTVAWLDGGRVRALGTHTELWRDPEYREVFGERGAADGGHRRTGHADANRTETAHTGQTDAAPADAAPADTGRGDTAPAHTEQGHAAPADTGRGDTAPADTGQGHAAPADTGRGDPAPADTGQGHAAHADTGQGDTAPAHTEQTDTAHADPGQADRAPAHTAHTHTAHAHTAHADTAQAHTPHPDAGGAGSGQAAVGHVVAGERASGVSRAAGAGGGTV